MSSSPHAPRSRSAFAAAFLSLIFPGLGHAYAGALARGLAFAAIPVLTLALTAGVILRADRLELLGIVLQPNVLYALLILNLVALVYRIVAVVDAWQVARFLNAVDASGGGRLGRARLPVNPLSVAGLLAVVLVLAGGHVALARYNVLALDFVDCVFTDTENPECELQGDVSSPGPSGTPGSEPTDEPSPTDVLPTPVGTVDASTPEPTLPPWDGKERLNILLVGADQRGDQPAYNTDTLIVVSIDPVTRQVAMFQVPRDTVDVPVPSRARPTWGSVYSGKINSWYLQNRVRQNLWPGSGPRARGYNALKAILGELYDLKIRYYVQVNFDGFRRVVNTLGGVQINVQIPVSDDTYPAGGALRRVYIPAGPQQMSGAQALIYARSRHGSQFGDFDRGRRQQRVLLSLREQMDPQAILVNLPELIDTLKRSVNTDIPAGPQQMSGAQALIYARSRHGSQFGDFDRGRRQQRVLLSLREQMDPQAILVNLPELIDTLKRSVNTDIPVDQLARLLALADQVDTRNVRSYVFSPPFYGRDTVDPVRGYIIEPSVSRIRRAVRDAFTSDPKLEALRERLGVEEARVWVLNESGRDGLATASASYLSEVGLDATAPNQRPEGRLATTKIVAYNGAEARLPETIAYLEGLFKVKATAATDRGVSVDVIVTLGRSAPNLDSSGPG